MKMIVIADDFTGSNDTGVQLAKKGARTEVMLTPAAETVAPRRCSGHQYGKPGDAGNAGRRGCTTSVSAMV